MSLLKSNSVQIGQSATATQNFTLSVPSSPDGTIKLARGNSGATTADILSVSSTGAITGATINGGAITSGTAQASTSGTAIDFTSIPSWAKRITVMLNGVSTNGTSPVVARLGTSGGIVSTSYFGSAGGCLNGASPLVVSTADGLYISPDGSASYGRHGQILISNITSNSWSMTLNGSDDGSLRSFWGCVSHSNLGGVLDRVRITTVGGANTFDAGNINIMYEG
jgi:hypothetical protein